MLSQLRMGSIDTVGSVGGLGNIAVERVFGWNFMRKFCVASGGSVATVGGLRAAFVRHEVDVAWRRGAWRGMVNFSTAPLSGSMPQTPQTTEVDRMGVGVNVVSNTVSTSSMGGVPTVTGSIRLPVYTFVNGSDDVDDVDGSDGGQPTRLESKRHSATNMDVPGDIFGQPLRTDILHRVVRWQLARRQQGTHKTKTRSEVRGGGRKPWQQKGSGRARQGTIRAVQWRGGGVVHGPVVRSHAHDLPKKVRRLGLAVAVSSKLEEGRLVVVDGFTDGDDAVSDAKTQAMLERIDGLLARASVPVTRRSVLMVDGAGGVPSSVVKSTRNIPWVDVIPVVGLNVYSILQRDVLVMTREAVEGLVTRLHTPIKR